MVTNLDGSRTTTQKDSNNSWNCIISIRFIGSSCFGACRADTTMRNPTIRLASMVAEDDEFTREGGVRTWFALSPGPGATIVWAVSWWIFAKVRNRTPPSCVGSHGTRRREGQLLLARHAHRHRCGAAGAVRSERATFGTACQAVEEIGRGGNRGPA